MTRAVAASTAMIRPSLVQRRRCFIGPSPSGRRGAFDAGEEPAGVEEGDAFAVQFADGHDEVVADRGTVLDLVGPEQGDVADAVHERAERVAEGRLEDD